MSQSTSSETGNMVTRARPPVQVQWTDAFQVQLHIPLQKIAGTGLFWSDQINHDPVHLFCCFGALGRFQAHEKSKRLHCVALQGKSRQFFQLCQFLERTALG